MSNDKNVTINTEGDEFIWNNFKFIIKRLENRRIDLMEVEILGGRYEYQEEAGNE